MNGAGFSFGFSLEGRQGPGGKVRACITNAHDKRKGGKKNKGLHDTCLTDKVLCVKKGWLKDGIDQV